MNITSSSVSVIMLKSISFYKDFNIQDKGKETLDRVQYKKSVLQDYQHAEKPAWRTCSVRIFYS